MTTKIYLVTGIDGLNDKVYVGKTITELRERDHKKRFGQDIKFSFIDEVSSTERRDWEPIESYWIEQFRQWGFTLLNKNKGGGGPEFHSEKTKRLISKRNLERSPEVIKKISETLKSSNFAKELSNKQTGNGNVSKRDEVKLKISKSVSELWKNSEYVNNRQPEPTVQCPHCGSKGKNRIMKRWHFDKCKYLLV